MDEEQEAESYRLRAEELRLIAGMARHETTRAALEQIAKDYDQMAVTMDGIARTRKEGLARVKQGDAPLSVKGSPSL